MTMKKLLIIVITCLSPLLALGQSKVKIEIQLITPDIIGEATLDKKPFFKWTSTIYNTIDQACRQLKGNKEIWIVTTVHKNKAATFSIGARPKITSQEIDALQKTLSQISSPRTKIVDYSLIFMVHINEGAKDKTMPFTPVPVIPKEKSYVEFANMSLAEKRAAMQAWAKNEVLPIIAFYTSNVDKKFEGVINIGKMLNDPSLLEKSVEDLTDRNPDYWRATMEMNKGNLLIPFTKVMLFVAKGEFDKARMLLAVTRFFHDKKTLPAIYKDELNANLRQIYRELGGLINQGIKLHDAKKYSEAVAHYNQVAKQFPNSGYLSYEMYLSTAFPMKDPEKQSQEWEKWKKIIYKHDPMYHMAARANSGREGYLMYLRAKSSSLFTKKDQFEQDFVEFNDIALDLGNYGLAAQMYWLTLSYLPKKAYNERNILAHYLYCLDKLGDKTTIKIFEGDFDKMFKEIEQERMNLMKKSEMYNSFKKKD